MASLAGSRRLNGPEETLLQKLVRSGHNLQPGTPTFPVESQPYLRKKLTEDGEIDVFSADKYFNGGIDIEKNMRNINLGTPRSYHSKTDEDSTSLSGSGIGFFAPMVQPRTPSIHSQSSWNSQSALLRTAVRNSAAKDYRMNKVQQGKKFLANLGCQCSCNDKKSIDIDDHISEQSGSRVTISTRPMRPSLDPSDIIKMKRLLLETDRRMKGEHCISSPITRPPPFKISSPPFTIVERIEEPGEARKSIEVFGANQELNTAGIRRSLTQDRKTNKANMVNMLAWDGIVPREDEPEITPLSGDHKDAESDASSDLFEIDCLSCMATPALACPQPDLTLTGEVAPTCYAPSEASIEWSVVTASAADFPAAASDVEDLPHIAASNRAKQVPTAAKSPRKVNDELQKRRPTGILSGCRSEKAVSVAVADMPRSHKKVMFEPQRHRRQESLTPMTRFQAESKASKERQCVVCPV